MRQGVEFAGVDAAGHQIVAGTFGGGFEQNGGFNFEEPAFVQKVADKFDRLVANDEIALEPFAAQIEIAVFEPQTLFNVFVPVNHKGRGFGRVENRDVFGQQFNVASVEVGVFLT